jgi:hypothetical protein
MMEHVQLLNLACCYFILNASAVYKQPTPKLEDLKGWNNVIQRRLSSIHLFLLSR